MIQIPYKLTVSVIWMLWLIARILCNRNKKINWKREAQLMLVYISIVVIVRFTFFPFGKIEGKIQPLLFYPENWFPFRINLKPFVFLLDYPTLREILLNFIGNYAMFIPVGIVWPYVFRELDKPWKTILAGIGFSLLIELIQLPFYDRVSDIDDLILNSLGYFTGYGVYLLIKRIRRSSY